jgi:transcription initiation factor IIE alpha subunit
MLLGHTPGGSPIYFSGPSLGRSRSKTLYACSADERHKLTKNQARSSGYVCTHCGADLCVKAEKVRELQALAKSLGYSVIK